MVEGSLLGLQKCHGSCVGKRIAGGFG